MRDIPTCSVGATALAVAGALLLSAPAAAQPPVPPSALASGPVGGGAPASPPGDAVTLTGTIRSNEARTRTLELIAGVGMALRVVRISCPEGTPVKAEGAAAGVSRLKPGDVVRVDYARTPKENVAKSIELLPKPEPGGAP